MRVRGRGVFTVLEKGAATDVIDRIVILVVGFNENRFAMRLYMALKRVHWFETPIF